jgi:hypothetical protein
MQRQSIDGDFAYALWSAETADNVYEMATDTHVVRDGKIVAQSFAGQIKPKRQPRTPNLRPADSSSAPAPATDGVT